MSNALANALKGAMKLGGNKAAKPEENDVDLNAVDENQEDDLEADGDIDDDDVDDASAEGEDGEDDDVDDDVSAEGGGGEDDDGETQPKPDAKTRRAVKAAVKKERNRCVAILTHANANNQPKLAAALLVDGTPSKKATKLLGSVEATKSGGNLASRMNSSQGSKRPGADGCGGKTPQNASERMAARNAVAQKSKQ